MNHDDMARLLPADRDLPAARKQILKEHLMTELRRADSQPGMTGQPGTNRTRPRRRRRQGEHSRRTVLVAGAVLTAAAVAVATAVVVGTSTSPPAPKAAQPAQPGQPAHAVTAAQLLARIAIAAARQPSPVVRDSDFMYIRSRVAYEVDSVSNGHETVTMEKPHERQIWLPVANICATGLLIEDGERTPISPFPVRERQGRPQPGRERAAAQLHLPQRGPPRRRQLPADAVHTDPAGCPARLPQGRQEVDQRRPAHRDRRPDPGDDRAPGAGRGAVPAGGDPAGRHPRPGRDQRGRPGGDRHHVDRQVG